MKNPLLFLLRPSAEIDRLSEEEPLFTGLLVFVVSVILGNLELVRSFFINWRAAIFNIFALISLWAGAMALGDLIYAFAVRLINPVSSDILSGERTRKFFIIQLHLSAILVFRPLLSLFLSIRLSWVLIFIWGATLVLMAAVRLWRVTELKGALALAAASVTIFAGSGILQPRENYALSDDFYKLVGEVSSSVCFDRVRLFHAEDPSTGFETGTVLKNLLYFADRNPGSPSVSYVYLAAARLSEDMDKHSEAEDIYRRLIRFGDAPSGVLRTARMNLRRHLSEEEYALIPSRPGATDWRPVLNLWKIPENFSDAGAEPGWAAVIYDIINTKPLEDFKEDLLEVLENSQSSAYVDDMYFWLARRMMREGETGSAMDYYRESASSAGRAGRERWKVEGEVEFLDRILGSGEILKEKHREPYALLDLGELLFKKGEYKEARSLLNRLSRRYRPHWAACRALEVTARIALVEGNPVKAADIYEEIEEEYRGRFPVARARRMRKVIEQDAQVPGLIETYASGLELWFSGEPESAFKIFNTLSEDHPDTLLSEELVFERAGMYRNKGEYVRAASEFAAGYSKYPDSSRRIDFAWEKGRSFESGGDYTRAADVYSRALQEYGPDFVSPVSERPAVHFAWRAAALYRDKLEDPAAAEEIYRSVTENSENPDNIARSIYEKGLVQENFYHAYRQALEVYVNLLSSYPETLWGSLAVDRIKKLSER